MRRRRALLAVSMVLASACNLVTGVGRFDFNAGGSSSAGLATSVASSSSASGGASSSSSTSSASSASSSSSSTSSASSTSSSSSSSGTSSSSSGCGASQKTCDNACVADNDPNFGCDPATCVACVPHAHRGVTCSAAACVDGPCDPGYMDCDGVAANGCEISTTNDPANCGTCGSPCAAGKICSASACVVACTAQVAAGQDDACVVKSDGTLWCWGDNTDGQLGLASTVNEASPTQVTTLGTSVTQIATGNLHTCALRTNGALWCWGDNTDGELGIGTTATPKSTPQLVAMGSTFLSIAAGSDQTCAVKSDNTLLCWGGNSNGDVGDGTMMMRTTPVQVLTSAAQVAAGALSTCALKTDGTVWCWGDNTYGEIGNGTLSSAPAPALVSLATSAVQITVGGGHACAVTTDKNLWCWGLDTDGQLGDGAFTNQPSPVQVTTTPAVSFTQVSAGAYHTCAITTADDLWCWGYDADGQLGLGTPGSPVAKPTRLGSGFVQVSAGTDDTCAIEGDGTPYCWGANTSGALGVGSFGASSSSAPVQASLTCP